MKLPALNLDPAPEWQKERLARWLAEWEIDRSLADEAGGRSNVPDDRNHPGVGDMARPLSGEPEVSAGQIRLLAPDICGCERLVYVAVLRREPDGRFLFAPFGRFSEPAVPGELLTGRDTVCLRVLCLWNAQTVSADILGRSWLADELTGPEIKEAMAVYSHVIEGGDLDSELEKRTAPPLIHPADPRHFYKDEENGLVSSLAVGSLVWPERADEERELPMAAEPPETYGSDDVPGSGEDPDGDEEDRQDR